MCLTFFKPITDFRRQLFEMSICVLILSNSYLQPPMKLTGFIDVFLILNKGEDPNEYSFTRIKLNWGGEEYGPYVSFGSFTAIIGTILMVGGAAKLFGLADALVGFMSTACSAVARLIFVGDIFFCFYTPCAD